MAAFFPHSAPTVGTESDIEVDAKLFEAVSRRAGVWLDVENLSILRLINVICPVHLALSPRTRRRGPAFSVPT